MSPRPEDSRLTSEADGRYNITFGEGNCMRTKRYTEIRRTQPYRSALTAYRLRMVCAAVTPSRASKAQASQPVTRRSSFSLTGLLVFLRPPRSRLTLSPTKSEQ
jgi:hypothetical protein